MTGRESIEVDCEEPQVRCARGYFLMFFGPWKRVLYRMVHDGRIDSIDSSVFAFFPSSLNANNFELSVEYHSSVKVMTSYYSDFCQYVLSQLVPFFLSQFHSAGTVRVIQ